MAHKLILLVEDNADDEVLALRALKKSGIEGDVKVVRDGVEALDFLFCTGAYADRDPSVLPDLVLLDLNLPKLDGLAVLNRIRSDERTKLLPVVALTTSVEESDRRRAYDLGVNSYIRKQVDYQKFTETVKQLGLYWLETNEPPPGPGE